jgi:diguanylate cyclase (GGDEF)-like protein
MIKPATPLDEATRIGTLRALDILDTAPEERFDRLTRLAKRLFGVPIALVSLVDTNRQWFKSCDGLGATETPREISFCGHAILSDEILLIPDALLDERFCDNPLVVGDPHIRFYAGCPLRAPNGSRLGTLCLIDREPRVFEADDLHPLRDLAHMAEQELAAVQLATTDELTQISNRRGFARLAEHALSLCRRIGTPASLLFLDLDRFKQVNDRYGHAEGDYALRSFAGLLMTTFRDSDVVGRMGGDEFVVLLTNASARACAEALSRLQQAVDLYNLTSERGYALAFSAGQLPYDPARHASIDSLLQEADALMYECKRDRRATG